MNSKKIFNKGLVIVLVLTVVFYASFLFYGDLNSIGELFFQHYFYGIGFPWDFNLSTWVTTAFWTTAINMEFFQI